MIIIQLHVYVAAIPRNIRTDPGRESMVLLLLPPILRAFELSRCRLPSVCARPDKLDVVIYILRLVWIWTVDFLIHLASVGWFLVRNTEMIRAIRDVLAHINIEVEIWAYLSARDALHLQMGECELN